MRSASKNNPKSKKARRPSDVFTQCPSCASPNIIPFEGDVFCTYCDWNSVSLRADAQFDSLQLYEPGLASVRYLGERADANAADDQKDKADFRELSGGFDVA